MKLKSIITFMCTVFYLSGAYAQKPLHPGVIKRMMNEARETGSLSCLLIFNNHDTLWAKDVEWKYNRKLDRKELRCDKNDYSEDSIAFYQDKGGFHAILHYTVSNGGKFNSDYARILKGKIDVFMSNWEPKSGGSNFTASSGSDAGFNSKTGQGSTFKPGGYTPNGSSNHIYPVFYMKTNVNLKSATYGGLKMIIRDNKAALAEYNAQFNPGEKQEEKIIDWGALKKVIDIYNN